MSVLPGPACQEMLFKTYTILTSRVLTTYLPAFKRLKKLVCWHIPHIYSDEMATKSEVVRKLHKLLCKLVQLQPFDGKDNIEQQNINYVCRYLYTYAPSS